MISNPALALVLVQDVLGDFLGEYVPGMEQRLRDLPKEASPTLHEDLYAPLHHTLSHPR